MLMVLFLFIISIGVYWFYHPAVEKETGNYLLYLNKAKEFIRNKRVIEKE